MTIDTSVQIWQDGNQFVAHAMPIDVMSSGPTPQAARTALAEALRLFVRTASEAGTLEQVLEECGYVRDQEKWVSPRIVASEQYAVAV